jgi:SsrA-binding protein
MEGKGLTLIPLSMYFKHGRAKVELGVGRGLKHYDKRDKLKEHDQKMDMARAVRRGG